MNLSGLRQGVVGVGPSTLRQTQGRTLRELEGFDSLAELARSLRAGSATNVLEGGPERLMTLGVGHVALFIVPNLKKNTSDSHGRESAERMKE